MADVVKLLPQRLQDMVVPIEPPPPSGIIPAQPSFTGEVFAILR